MPLAPLEHFSIRDGCGYLRPEGETTVAAFLVLLSRAMAGCQAAGANRLLVNGVGLRHPPLTTTDRYAIGATIAATWDPGVKLALVGRADQIDPSRFGALVARNRGFRVEAFESEDAALLWLAS
jgi:hypothetical protein